MRSPSAAFAAVVLVAFLVGAGCQPADVPAPDPAPAGLHVRAWPLPAPDGASLPGLVRTPGDALLLSWVEPEGEGHALRFARHDAQGWSEARTIARGDDWFVNWADTPHLAATPDGALWAQWLRKSAAAPYAYDVVLSRSADGGSTWSTPVTVNDDGTPTEHGFVSLWADGHERLGIAWLDGRETGSGGGGHDAHAAHGAGGAMTLRAASFDAGLVRGAETRVDASTCDCCQTDVALADGIPVLAYRDRTPDEVRDILLVRLVDGDWTVPAPVHTDGWRIPACPVNGPALSAAGTDLVVAWYTEADGHPAVRVAHSHDGGRGFDPPHDLDTGEAVLGRVATGIDLGGAWVAWLREETNGQRLRIARLAHRADTAPVVADTAAIAGRGRGTGFPQLAVAGDAAYLAWTEVVDGRPRLRGAIVDAR